MQTKKTDNSYLTEKVKLREKMLVKKQSYKVLDMFHGEGKLWDKVKADGYDVKVTGIDIKRGIDNRKLKGFVDFTKYDVIDFDSYGDGIERMLCYIDEIKEGAIVFVTLITLLNHISHKTKQTAGIEQVDMKLCPTLWGDSEVVAEMVKSVLSKYTKDFYIFSPVKNKNYIGFKKTKSPVIQAKNTF